MCPITCPTSERWLPGPLLLSTFLFSYALHYSAPEHMRLNGQHIALVSMMHGQVIQALPRSPRRILEVGCGLVHS